jgi:hypothetical protein
LPSRTGFPPSRMLIACEYRCPSSDSPTFLTQPRYFIKDGKVSESGTHEQLLALRGGYYEYTALQNLSGH